MEIIACTTTFNLLGWRRHICTYMLAAWQLCPSGLHSNFSFKTGYNPSIWQRSGGTCSRSSSVNSGIWYYNWVLLSSLHLSTVFKFQYTPWTAAVETLQFVIVFLWTCLFPECIWLVFLNPDPEVPPFFSLFHVFNASLSNMVVCNTCAPQGATDWAPQSTTDWTGGPTLTLCTRRGWLDIDSIFWQCFYFY